MLSTSVILIASGIACVGVSGFMLYRLTPQEGRPSPAWMKAESLATAIALGTFVLLVAGVTLVAKGIFS